MSKTKSDTDQRYAELTRVMEEVIPFNRHLGLRVDHLAPGHCVLRAPWAETLTGDPFRPSVHGGVLAVLIDTAGGAACWTLLEKREDRVSTVDMRVDYLRPFHGGDLVCDARVIRMGNRVGVVRMEVRPAEAEAEGALPIATGQGVYNVARFKG